MAQFLDKVIFGEQPDSFQVKVDPTGLTLPTMTVGKVYGIDGSKDIILSTDTTTFLLGVYVGVNDAGFLLFEQKVYTSVAAFTGAGTSWYLTAAGALTSTPNDALFGVAIDADNLLIIWSGQDTGGIGAGEANTTSNAGGGIGLALTKSGLDLPFRTLTSPGSTVGIVINGNEVELESFAGADVQENDVSEEDPVDTLNFLTDIAGGKPFADLSNPSAGQVDVEIDKQIDYGPLAGLGNDAPTGFSFVAATYRSCEVVYYLEKVTGETEAGTIVMTHDGTNAGVTVVKRDSSVAPLTAGAPGVTFSADINAGNCRLLYTETNDDVMHLSVKARPIRPPQIITVEFSLASSNVVADVPKAWTWNIIITTSDGLPTRQSVDVDVIDDGTGSADGSDYTMSSPQSFNFPAGTTDGSTLSPSLSVLGNNENDDVDTSLANLTGAIYGTNTTHQINLQAGGA